MLNYQSLNNLENTETSQEKVITEPLITIVEKKEEDDENLKKKIEEETKKLKDNNKKVNLDVFKKKIGKR